MAMPAEGAIMDLVEDPMAKPAPWPQGDKTTMEMNSILEETLECLECDTTATRAEMEADITSGRVDLSIDPSFLMAPKEELVDPFDMPPAKTYTPGYLNGASTDQIERYKEKAGGSDLETYAFQRHLHVHRVGRQGCLSLCRELSEIQEIREWSIGLDYENKLLKKKDKIDIENDWGKTQENKSMPDQEFMWWINSDKGEERLAESRKRWKLLLRERREQRKEAKKARREDPTIRERRTAHLTQLHREWWARKREYYFLYERLDGVLEAIDAEREVQQEAEKRGPRRGGRRRQEPRRWDPRGRGPKKAKGKANVRLRLVLNRRNSSL
ncbi:hypothetical protein FQN54_005405 [Arachnomyces sp. PD_36]|nr:hypothetical protein FQN54_005405 [Arachnomyces sp. PD_36]